MITEVRGMNDRALARKELEALGGLDTTESDLEFSRILNLIYDYDLKGAKPEEETVKAKVKS